jgi:hypothetical protein
MIIRYSILLLACLVCVACNLPTTGVSISGYNHMKRIPIHFFTANGALGPNVGAESGGKQSCCVEIPNEWRPGLKVRIAWTYDSYLDDPNPPLPPQEAVVDVPKYAKPGIFQVHFYPDHRVKIVVSSCLPEHAFYPMSKEDLLPWTPRESKADTAAAAKSGGWLNDC